jgi:hypothetical protein
LDNDNDEDIPDDGVSEYERQRLERIAQNNARLAMLGLINNQEKKKKKKKIAPRSIATDGPMRRNPERSSRNTTSEGGVPSAPPSVMRTGESAEGGVPSAPPLVIKQKIPTGISKYYWTTIEESRLLDWFNASGLDDFHHRINDFSEIATENGRTKRACREKLMIIVAAGVLTKDVINFLIDRFQNYKYNQEVPPDMRLDKLSSADDYIKSFKERQEIGASAFHITQVHPEQMCCLNKELFIQLNPSLQIDVNKHILLDDLDGKQCILADNYIRQQGIHDFEMTPIPHIKHPTTGDFRIDIHDKTYLSS